MYFKINEQGAYEHYIDSVLRATIATINFDDYLVYFPDCVLITA